LLAGKHGGEKCYSLHDQPGLFPREKNARCPTELVVASLALALTSDGCCRLQILAGHLFSRGLTMASIPTSTPPGESERAGAGAMSLEEKYQRCLAALQHQEQELRKCRASVWLMKDWWEQHLKWLVPAN